MKNRVIASRYARALLDSAERKGVEDKALKEIRLISDQWQEDEKIRAFLSNPDFTKDEKKQLIKNSFSKIFGELFLNFLYLLIAKNRLDYLPDINEEYVKFYYQLKGKEKVKIVAARPVNKSLLNKMENRLKELIKKEIVLEEEVSPEVLGGVSIHFQDRIIDGTVQHNLKQLKENLLKALVF